MGIYALLAKYRGQPHAFEKTEEFEFFIKNREIFNKMARFDFLYNKEASEFDIIRANILLLAYFNKVTIEQEIANINEKMSETKFDKMKFLAILKEKIVDLPYLMFGKVKVYVPIFNIPLNIVYYQHPEKLLTFPYNQLQDNFAESLIDTFDMYGPALYNSYFTRLVKIGTNGQEVAFFNYDTNAIYIVNNQGRLDNQICLFDRFIKKPHLNHMLERLRPLIDAYFNKTKQEFIDELIKNEFISEKMLTIIKKEETHHD